MNKNLPQMVAELFNGSKIGEDLSPRIQRLRDEISKAVRSDDSVLEKFRVLLESFRTIIPEEKQRYLAAVQALSTTAKLSRQEIIKAIGDQLEELKVVEKNLSPAVPGWRDEVKSLEAKALATKGEMSKLREAITRLEGEEKATLASLAARQKELDLVDKTLKELFAGIGTEIDSIRKKVVDLPPEAPVAPPLPQAEPVKPAVQAAQSAPPAAAKIEVPDAQKAEAAPPSPPLDPRFQRKCPMCGGPFNLLELEHIWQCYTCAYEEPAEGGGPAAQKKDSASRTENAPKEVPSPSDAPAPASEPAAPLAVPIESLNLDDLRNEKKESSPARQMPPKKKTCPVCTKKMTWLPNEKKWRCPSCEYERRAD